MEGKTMDIVFAEQELKASKENNRPFNWGKVRLALYTIKKDGIKMNITTDKSNLRRMINFCKANGITEIPCKVVPSLAYKDNNCTAFGWLVSYLHHNPINDKISFSSGSKLEYMNDKVLFEFGSNLEYIKSHDLSVDATDFAQYYGKLTLDYSKIKKMIKDFNTLELLDDKFEKRFIKFVSLERHMSPILYDYEDNFVQYLARMDYLKYIREKELVDLIKSIEKQETSDMMQGKIKYTFNIVEAFMENKAINHDIR